MAEPDFQLRPFEDHDAAAVEALLRAAFDRQREADLVVDLRAAGSVHSEWVVTTGSRIIGHMALSWMAQPARWACLAPLAVQPDWQGQGVGRMLASHVPRVIEKPDGPETVVVLGDPAFYTTVGFDLDRARSLDTRYPVENTLICRPGDDIPEARLVYPAAFG